MFPARVPIISQPPSAVAAANYSLSFDGTDDFVDLRDGSTDPAGLPLTNSPRTIAMWISPSNVGYGQVQLFSYGAAGIAKAINFTQFHSGKIKVDNYGSVVTSSAFLSLNTWSLVVLALDGSTGCKMYGNADEVADGTFGADLNTEHGSYFTSIGAYNYNGTTRGGFYRGLMDDVAVWNVELDADAVTAIYNSGVPIDLTSDSGNYDNSGDLVAYWRFNEGVGTEVAETTGTANVYAGTIINGATWSTDVPS